MIFLHDTIHVSFDSTGIYDVKLYATTLAGCVYDTTKQINVRPSPKAKYLHTNACLNETVLFFNLTETQVYNPLIEQLWIFDNQRHSSLTNPAFSFDSTGYHYVELFAKATNGCESRINDSIYVGNIPVAKIFTTDYCENSVGIILDSSFVNDDKIVKWKWIIDSIGTIEIQNPQVIFDYSGKYDITLEVETESGCKNSDISYLEVFPNPKADFDYSPKFGASPLRVQFFNKSEGGYDEIWLIEDSIININNPEYTFFKTGNHPISLYAISNKGCSDTITKYISTRVSNIDITIVDVIVDNYEQYMTLSTELLNSGSTPLYSIEFVIQTSHGTIREEWTGELAPGELLKYKPSSQIFNSKNSTISFICITANIKGNEQEIYATDNYCTSFSDKFEVINHYPNPVDDILTVELISPSDADVVFEIYNNSGKLSKKYSVTLNNNYHKINVDLKNLQAGLYSCKIILDKNNKYIIKKFIKN
jgi:PKD repeat protein